MTVKQKPKKSVREYLDALVWDQKPRIDRWLIDYAGAPDTPYVRAVSRAVLVAAARRARQPGCKFDEMLVLESLQGAGKSSALRILAGDDWFTDDFPFADTRRLIEVTAGKWIVEAAELSCMGEGDIAALKAYLSRSHDEARMVYQREITRAPRQFVIVGTTGDADYLRDTTGNRRFWPVSVQRFALDRLRIDRDQLWAEAAAIEATGVSIRFVDAVGEQPSAKQLPKRCSISVTGDTYARLRALVTSTSLQEFINQIITSALDDPAIMERVVARCRSMEPR